MDLAILSSIVRISSLNLKAVNQLRSTMILLGVFFNPEMEVGDV